ncbi:MAG TPA: hypothetical protein VFE24_11815 [Pirellulales bacterium]|nr:hypothetical protein [Pirellulales bacterium]
MLNSAVRFGFVLVLLVFGLSPARAELPAERWVYLQQNLQVNENMPKVESILRRAAKAGYNGVVLADYKLNVLDRVTPDYFRNAEKFKALCKELSLEIIPTVMPFGYSDGLLAHDPNLAEGLPCRAVPFRAHEGVAVLDGENPNLIPGDFEAHRGNAFSGWGFQDEPGKGTFVDEKIKHGGQSSLRIENAPGVSGNRRVNKALKVRPWTQYHASVWIKTDGFKAAREVRMFAIGTHDRTLSHSNLGVKPTQDWTEHHIIFNSLDAAEVQFYIGVWGAGGGQLWMDDASVREAPFVNLVRRPSCPLTVADETGQTIYVEGRDFAELHDPKMGNTPWAGNYDVYHEPPRLKLLAGSRIAEGQKLRVSYYHTVTIYDNQVACSLSDPKVFEIAEEQVRRVDKLFSPRRYFLSHDEIRVANWSAQDEKAGLSAGALLAANVKQCVEIIHRVNPPARMCIWSDMFDPYHNAVNHFYLVNGDLAGSWEGLPKEMLIVNWNSEKAAQSLPFFAKRGHSQVLAGYYDAPPERIANWLLAGKGLPGINGVMYTTWQNNYSDLEKFAAAAWGKKE